MKKKAIWLAPITILLVIIMVLSAVPPVGGGTPDVTGTGEISVFWDRWDRLNAGIAGFGLSVFNGPGCRTQFLYTQAELINYGVEAGPVGEIGFINAWGKTSTWAGGWWQGNNNYLNLKIIISNVPSTKTAMSSTFALNYGSDGGVIAFYQPGWTALDGYHDQAFWFDTSAAGFVYEGNGLVVEISFDSISGNTAYFGWYWSFLNGYWGDNSLFPGPNYYGGIWYYLNSINPTGYLIYGNIMVLCLSISAIPADSRIEPQTLNLDSNGNWVSVKVENFPENPEYSPLDVDGSTVAVAGTGVDLKFGTLNENRWIGKCDRLIVEDSIGAPGDDVEISVTGSLSDGTAFLSTAVIDAI